MRFSAEYSHIKYISRVGQHLADPWFFLLCGAIAFKARTMPWHFIFLPILIIFYTLVVLRTQRVFIDRLQIEDDTVFISYRKGDTPHTIETPASDLDVELMAKTKGPTGGASLKFKIGNAMVLRQYENRSWTRDELARCFEALTKSQS